MTGDLVSTWQYFLNFNDASLGEAGEASLNAVSIKTQWSGYGLIISLYSPCTYSLIHTWEVEREKERQAGEKKRSAPF